MPVLQPALGQRHRPQAPKAGREEACHQLQAEARADAKKQIEKVREATEKKVRAELEGQQSKHERALERTIQGLQKQNTDLERKLEELSAPGTGRFERGGYRRAA